MFEKLNSLSSKKIIIILNILQKLLFCTHFYLKCDFKILNTKSRKNGVGLQNANFEH